MTETVVTAKFRIRRDTAANWTSVNPVLELGEPGLETDTRLVKYGDGTTAWTGLAYHQAYVSWGAITGTLTNQSDLVAALALNLTASRNLDDLANATTARGNLGLGNVDNTSDVKKSIGGNAATATVLQTARTINGVSFNGSANITIPVGGSGTVTSFVFTNGAGITGSVTNASTTPALALTLGAITPTSVVATGAVSGSNLSGTNTGDQTSVTGNAGTATKLTTARNINGVAFDGTASITINAVDSTARLAVANNLSDLATPATARANLGVAIGSNVQAWDADLDALAAATGTNTIYYRSAANTWSAVVIGTNVTFSGGTLASQNPGGTVTSVSVTTANGISGTVANAGTTPAIALTLSAITPSTVAATGNVTGANLSGTNTGDQTLTGDVTSSGAGASTATTIGANKVTFSKLIAATQPAFIGATAAGNFGEITPTSGRTLLGLGTMATQSASGVAITGGTLSGLTSIGSTGLAQVSSVRATGFSFSGATGPGAELFYLDGRAQFIGYDRTAGSYVPAAVDAAGFAVKVTGTVNLNLGATVDNTKPTWSTGSGSPNGAVTAVVGSLFTRTDGGAATTLYVKETGSGNTGWVAK